MGLGFSARTDLRCSKWGHTHFWIRANGIQVNLAFLNLGDRLAVITIQFAIISDIRAGAGHILKRMSRVFWVREVEHEINNSRQIIHPWMMGRDKIDVIIVLQHAAVNMTDDFAGLALDSPKSCATTILVWTSPLKRIATQNGLFWNYPAPRFGCWWRKIEMR